MAFACAATLVLMSHLSQPAAPCPHVTIPNYRLPLCNLVSDILRSRLRASRNDSCRPKCTACLHPMFASTTQTRSTARSSVGTTALLMPSQPRSQAYPCRCLWAAQANRGDQQLCCRDCNHHQSAGNSSTLYMACIAMQIAPLAYLVRTPLHTDRRKHQEPWTQQDRHYVPGFFNCLCVVCCAHWWQQELGTSKSAPASMRHRL
jgi:hypothetical protein